MNSRNKKKHVFIGMEEAGYVCLKALLEKGLEPCAVFTAHESLKDSIIAYRDFSSLERPNIPFYYVKSINSPDSIDLLRRMSPDLVASLYWSELLDKEILNIPPMGCVGSHGTLLPKHRGRAPIPWSIIQGVRISGVTLFYMTDKPDDGNIIARESYRIDHDDYASDVYRKSMEITKKLFVKYIPLAMDGHAPRIKQEDVHSDYWPRRKPQDGLIDWNKSASHLYDWIRALSTPFPGAFSYLGGHKVVINRSKVHSGQNYGQPARINWESPGDGIVVSTGEGALEIDDFVVDGEHLDKRAFRSRFSNHQSFFN